MIPADLVTPIIRPTGHRPQATGYRLPALCLLSAALLTATACTRPASNVQEGNQTQVLHRGIGAEPASLDPHLVTTVAEIDMISALFEGLVTEDPVDLHPVPGVAESWEAAPDGLGYTFRLRANARWSNGDPLTAGDFVAAWRRMLTPSLGAENAGMLYLIENAEAYHKGAITDFSQVGVSAPDPRTLRVRLDQPAPHFLALLSHAAWMPVHRASIEALGGFADRANPWARPGTLVGNGPFRLESWAPNQRIVAVKSDNYWDAAAVRLNAVHFHPIESLDAEERAFRTGQLHLTYALPAGKAEVYRSDAPQLLRTDRYLDTYFLRANVTRPFLNDARVRRALGMAIDRTALVDRVLRGGQTAASAITPPGAAGYQPPPGIPSDPEAARRLLTEAGYPGGAGLPAFELLLPNSENLRLIAEALQAMWRTELGVEVRLATQEARVVRAERAAGNYQLLLYDWVGDFVDPLTFLEPWRSDSANNHTRWANADYDAAIREAGLTLDAAQRNTIYRRAETLLLEHAPIIPLYYNVHAFLIQPSVRGWNPTLLDHHPYKHVWLEP